MLRLILLLLTGFAFNCTICYVHCHWLNYLNVNIITLILFHIIYPELQQTPKSCHLTLLLDKNITYAVCFNNKTFYFFSRIVHNSSPYRRSSDTWNKSFYCRWSSDRFPDTVPALQQALTTWTCLAPPTATSQVTNHLSGQCVGIKANM